MASTQTGLDVASPADELGSFEYIEKCFLPDDFDLDQLDGCLCEDSCATASCPCVFAFGIAFYDENSHTLTNDAVDQMLSAECRSLSIFECNSRCACDHNCIGRLSENRAVAVQPFDTACSSGVEYELAVLRTDSKGLGVFNSGSRLPPGLFIGEYTGEALTPVEADMSPPDRKRYTLSYNEVFSNGKDVYSTHVCAASAGNFTRFINHSCRPNCAIVAIRKETFRPQLCVFTVKPVDSGEEITFHYSGGDVHCALSQTPCHCGNEGCMGYLPA